MKRRTFIRSIAVTTAAFHIASDIMGRDRGPVYGHNGMRYTMDTLSLIHTCRCRRIERCRSRGAREH